MANFFGPQHGSRTVRECNKVRQSDVVVVQAVSYPVRFELQAAIERWAGGVPRWPVLQEGDVDPC